MARPKKEKLSQETDGLVLSEESAVDYGDDFPISLELPYNELSKLSLYNYVENGRVHKSGIEIVCVDLLSKHI